MYRVADTTTRRQVRIGAAADSQSLYTELQGGRDAGNIKYATDTLLQWLWRSPVAAAPA